MNETNYVNVSKLTIARDTITRNFTRISFANAQFTQDPRY